jgi:transitional endoplasmic reticulum ATPase
MNEFIGQNRIRQALSIAIEAARLRGEAMGHVLLIGDPGGGKKTLATIIANELQVPCTVTSGSALKTTLDLTGILSNIRGRQVLLIDNINELSPSLKPMLTSALNDFRVDIQVGAGPGARTHSLPMPRFTLVGTSCKPIKGIPTDRFALVLTLSEYTPEEMAQIVIHSVKMLDIAIDDTGAMELGRRAHGTPGEISRLLRTVRDYAQVRSSGTIIADIVREALDFIGNDFVTPRNQPVVRPDAAEAQRPLTHHDINRSATAEEIAHNDESLRNRQIGYESNKIWEKWGFNECGEPFDGVRDDDAQRRHLEATEEIAIRLQDLGLLRDSNQTTSADEFITELADWKTREQQEAWEAAVQASDAKFEEDKRIFPKDEWDRLAREGKKDERLSFPDNGIVHRLIKSSGVRAAVFFYAARNPEEFEAIVKAPDAATKIQEFQRLEGIAERLFDDYRKQLDDSSQQAAQGSGREERPHEAPNTGRGLSRVAGMTDLKEQLTHEVIRPFDDPELYSRYRVALPNGILFFGPPGCGKTYLARSLAEELGWHFQYCRPSDVASPYIHDTVNRIRAVFAAATEKAPSIIFIDEFEAFVPARSELGGHQQYKAEEVNEFLANLEGCAERKVLVIAATNEPERIDPAVRRSGRFDKLILIPPPDAEARRAMLEFHLRDRPIEASLDIAGISAVLEGYSASDIKLLVDEAARLALKRKALIETRTLLAALERVPASITAEDMQRYEGFRSRGT